MPIFNLLSSENPLVMAFVFIVGGALLLMWIFILLDCLIRNFSHHGRITGRPALDKFIWFLIVCTGIGAVIYFFAVRRTAPHINS